MLATQIHAIDAHAHYGPFYREGLTELRNRLCSGDAETVLERARAANTEWTIVSPLRGLFPRGKAMARVEAANEETAQLTEQSEGLLQWVIVEPRRPETYRQAERMLGLPRCVGIKIHGEEHCYDLADHGDALFEFAARHQAVVLAHSGNARTMPMAFVPFADRYPEVRLILAHLGHCEDADGDPSHQVRAIQASKHGNVYTDTSSMKSVLPGLIEWAVAQVGPERILYGTDSPLYFAPNQRARIDHAQITEDQKRLILRDNAVALFELGPQGPR